MGIVGTSIVILGSLNIYILVEARAFSVIRFKNLLKIILKCLKSGVISVQYPCKDFSNYFLVLSH